MDPCTYFSSTFHVLCGSLCHLTLCSGEIYTPAAWSLSLYWRWISRMICYNRECSSPVLDTASKPGRLSQPCVTPHPCACLGIVSGRVDECYLPYLVTTRGSKVKMSKTKVAVLCTQSSSISIPTGGFLVNKIFTTTMLPMKKWHNHHW